MDGLDLRRRVQQLLNEDSDSGWLDKRSTYDFLYDAAQEFVDRTHCLKSTQTITTVAGTSEYDLSADFLKLYLQDTSYNYVVKWGSYDFIPWKNYSEITYANNTDETSLPNSFSITDADLPDRVTGTATGNGTESGGVCTLAGAGFGDVEAGAIVHNTTDTSSGIVVSKTSSSSLQTALFGGTNNDWSTSDAYVIQPQGRMKLVLEQPPDGAYTIKVYYVQRPAPVYTDYDVYKFQAQYIPALVRYAFWLYKYRDKEPNFGDGMYRYFDDAVRKAGYSLNQTLNKQVRVNFKV